MDIVSSASCASSSRDSGCDNFLGFEIDTTPTGRHERFVVPEYDNKKKYMLVGDAVKELNDLKSSMKRRRPGGGGGSCWNCGNWGHSNRECPEPVNYENMQRNRQQFLNNRSTRTGALRYHTDNEQKFNHLRPGMLSSSLRKALGLKHNQVPRHIYNMRLLGYPPGWLEEAKVLHSGITLFDGRGNVVADPDDEEGEVVENTDQRNKYDMNKLIRYPGFNFPLPPDVVDDWEKRNLPPMNAEHSLDNLVAYLRPNEAKAYRRKKVPIIPSATPPRERNEESQDSLEVDMDCEETPEIGFLPDDGCSFVPALPDEVETPPPPPPPPSEQPPPAFEDGECSNSEIDSQTLDRKSPTLNALEEQKKSILEELNNTDSSESLKPESIKSPTIARVKKSDPFKRTPSPNLGRMKSVDLGTPILKSVSPYSKLPSNESFSQNICDVINFENLPNSTGIYDKMVDVINKVRLAVKGFPRD